MPTTTRSLDSDDENNHKEANSQSPKRRNLKPDKHAVKNISPNTSDNVNNRERTLSSSSSSSSSSASSATSSDNQISNIPYETLHNDDDDDDDEQDDRHNDLNEPADQIS